MYLDMDTGFLLERREADVMVTIVVGVFGLVIILGRGP
jgi:hypothetical protein